MAENLVIKHGNKGQLPNNKEKGTIYFAKDPNNTSHGKIYYDTPEATSVRVDMSGCGYTDSGEGAEIFNNYSGTDKNKASGNYSHAEGYATEASGSYSHTSGLGTVAKGDSQTVIGRYNILDNDNSYAFIIGSGTDNTSRSNALTVNWNGVAEFSGVVKSDGKELLTNSDASSTYLSKTDASNTYLTKTNASSIYLNKTNASNTYLDKTSASNTYLTKTNASNTYLDKTSASNTYAKLSGGNSFSGNQTITGTLSQGSGCSANGEYSYAGGWSTVANGNWGCHAEGNGSMTNSSSGEGANHAEGWWTGAYGQGAHAEGYSDSKILEKASSIYTNDSSIKTNWNSNKFLYAKGQGAHAEGVNTLSIGVGAHAEGTNSVAIGDNAYAGGLYCHALAKESHAEGWKTTALGNQSHAEGDSGSTSAMDAISNLSTYTSDDTIISTWNSTKFTLAKGNKSHAEGFGTLALAETSHSQGQHTISRGIASHAQGYLTQANGVYSHAEGHSTQANASCAHAEGDTTKALVHGAHSEGVNTEASGEFSGPHAEGNYTKAQGQGAHAEGAGTATNRNLANGQGAHAEGNCTVAEGQGAHAEGVGCTASGAGAHAEGDHASATGKSSHASGEHTQATGRNSYAGGCYTKAVGTAQTVVGRYNQGRSDDANGPDSFFIVGVGTSATAQSNGFRVDRFGNCFSKAGLLVHQDTADFAEYFEWEDGNLLNEDRRGLFVTLNNNKIRLANLNDTYILGAISTTGAFIGNAGSEEWKNRFVKNIFEEIQYEDVVVSTEETLNNGEVIVKETIEKHPILNPDYNSEEEYIPRSERLEWDVVGLCGQVIVVDDGTCEVNGYCRPYVDGIASSFTIDDIDENIPNFMKEFYLTTKGFRVMERLDKNHIKVLIK